MRYLYITVILTALPDLLIPLAAKAQAPQGSGSPYSAYGIGDLYHSTQVSQALMGVTGIGLIDPFSVIHANPASYVSLRTPAFETGMVTRTMRADMEDVTSLGGRTDLLGFTLGVPIGRGSILQGAAQPANRWGFALGLNPVSRVGYRIGDTSPLPDGSGDVRFEYAGEGGLNRAFIGLGLTLWQSNDTINKGTRLALGANLNYMFGTIEASSRSYFPQAINAYNSSIRSRLVIRAPTANVGTQLSGDLISQERADRILLRRRERALARDSIQEERWIQRGRDPKDRAAASLPTRPNEPFRYTLGISAELPASLGAESTELVNSFIIGSTGVEFPIDTSYFHEGTRGAVEIPVLLGVGLSVYNSRWTLVLEHRRRDWSEFTIRFDDQMRGSGLTTQAVYAVGASFRPAGERRGTLLGRSTYRAGIRYGQDYRVVAGTQLQEIGMGFGMAVPVMSNTTRSRITFGVELGERGTTSEGLLRERFANVFVGITITPDLREQWFKKRRLE